jgi:MFS family permease
MDRAGRLLAAKAVRGLGDGFTALLLPAYLAELGFTAGRVGAIATAALLGSAALTLAVGLGGHRLQAKRLLVVSCGLMLATGVGFSLFHGFWALAAVAFLGTFNPSGDVSVFVPLEQAMLAHAPAERRTAIYARYSLTGALATAVGALAVAMIDPLRAAFAVSRVTAYEAAFLIYGLLGLAAAALYAGLPDETAEAVELRTGLGPSRRRVLQLAGLFSVDSFGGGFLANTLIALWLFGRFGMSLKVGGAFFFWAGVLGAFSQLLAPRLARRIGLVNTMVFTHIPASACVIAAAFAPSLPWALTFLLLRASMQSMDVPARTAFVMAVVTPAERAAAAGVTNVPRSLAGALSPAIAGALYAAQPFAWPLVIGGVLKIGYDVALLAMFRRVKPDA